MNSPSSLVAMVTVNNKQYIVQGHPATIPAHALGSTIRTGVLQQHAVGEAHERTPALIFPHKNHILLVDTEVFGNILASLLSPSVDPACLWQHQERIWNLHKHDGDTLTHFHGKPLDQHVRPWLRLDAAGLDSIA
eukprot:m.269515 g.269515  ORF g.269515 m.269515 type:complete len:135 (+) comp19734_c0_seq70:2461-2865(+)